MISTSCPAAVADAHVAESRKILAWALDRFAGRIVLTCSWQRQSSVLIDLLAELGTPPRIVEIDTGMLFPETHATREALIERYGIAVETIRPRVGPPGDTDQPDGTPWTAPEQCCFIRKVEPFERALAGMDAWITGIRRTQSPSRSAAQPLEDDPVRGVLKVQPLVAWSDDQVMDYLHARDVPYNALHDRGYPSIGCMPCTLPASDGADQRSGRWAGSAKTECGLHRAA